MDETISAVELLDNAEVNWVLFSLSGIQCSSIMDFRCAIIVFERMFFNFRASGNLL